MNGEGKKRSRSVMLFIIGLVIGTALTIMFTVILYYDYGFDELRRQAAAGKDTKVEISSEKKDKDDKDDSSKEEAEDGPILNDATIAKLKQLERTIDTYFFLDRPDNDELRDGLYKGLMSSLGDVYTEYYTAEEYEDLMEQTEGIYYGIGAYVSIDSVQQLPKISSIIPNSPASESDLRPNDLIYEIDGEPTYGETLTEAVARIKGPEGTPVVIRVIREGVAEPIEMTFIRRKVEAPTVQYSMLEDKMAMIQVTEFDDITTGQFEEALNSAKADGAKGIILDLRSNPGGSLSTVVDMCKMILPEGVVVSYKGNNNISRVFTNEEDHTLQVPLVVLVDMNSASAAEIMAGAIKDYGIGTLVGTTTFGKGIVQQIIPFRDGSAVKITISAYYTPSGENIHGIGIEPDIVCEFDGDAYYGSDDHPDNQLEKAKEILREKMMK